MDVTLVNLVNNGIALEDPVDNATALEVPVDNVTASVGWSDFGLWSLVAV